MFNFVRAKLAIRVPLPAKVLLSYLLVVMAGALPTFVYVKHSFRRELATDVALDVAHRTVFMARALAGLSKADRLDELKRVAVITRERITYIDAGGHVLFDSSSFDPGKLGSHADRDEIKRALGLLDTHEAFDPRVRGVGVSQRVSEVTNVETMYVASRIDPVETGPGDVLRLSIPMTRVEEMSMDLISVFRNSQAIAVSVALLLSMLAATLFMRPLQRVTTAAHALASGDYTIALTGLANDEVGDVGRALQKLSGQLRRRLALAEAGDALLLQLVSTLPLPIVVFGTEQRVMAINSPARTLLHAHGMASEDNIAALLHAPAYVTAVAEALRTYLPVPLRTEVELRGEGMVTIDGWVNVLSQPDQPPCTVFFGGETKVRRIRSLLPDAAQGVPVALSDVLRTSLAQAEPWMRAAAIVVKELPMLPDVQVVEVEHRLRWALLIGLEGVVPALMAEKEALAIGCKDEPNAVAVIFKAGVANEAVAAMTALLQPLGGSVQASHRECTVWLPKA